MTSLLPPKSPQTYRIRYVIHTTGRSKGIPVSHISSTTALQYLIQMMGMGPDTRLRSEAEGGNR